MRRALDTSQAIRVGLTAKMRFDEGLRQTVVWYEQQGSANLQSSVA
jgi:dTDP-D-glucose 4,6-dehydratase